SRSFWTRVYRLLDSARPTLSALCCRIGALHKLAQEPDMGRAIVQAGNITVVGAPGGQEESLVLDRNFFQRFQAVDCEARTGDKKLSDAAVGQISQGSLGVGLEPDLFAESRLEAHSPLLLLQAELGGECSG